MTTTAFALSILSVLLILAIVFIIYLSNLNEYVEFENDTLHKEKAELEKKLEEINKRHSKLIENISTTDKR